MNNKLIIGIGAVVIVAGGAVLFLSKNNSIQTQQTQQTVPSQMPSGSTTASPSSPAIAGNFVQITNFSFSPATLMVKVGDKVTWTNQDTVGHSATADDGSFDTGALSTGQSGSVTFSKAGTYAYHCSVHPSMKGTIIVQ